MVKKVEESELVLNKNNCIYHLDLLPGEISDTIILVGDPARVKQVSSFFQQVEVEKSNREFHTVTGTFSGKRLSVISTGIGTDNIDIVVNELDILTNFDLQKREPKKTGSSLNLFRIGTSGSIHPEIEPGSAVVSDFAMGLDNLMDFYEYEKFPLEQVLENKIREEFDKEDLNIPFYLIEGSAVLRQLFGEGFHHGITVVAPGFYGPQGRQGRIPLKYPRFLEVLQGFSLSHLKILNFEMETSAIYGLSRVLDHNCCTVDLVIANRATGNFLADYHDDLNRLIEKTLHLICGN